MGSMKKIILYLEWGSILGLLSCGLWVFLKLPIETSQGVSAKNNVPSCAFSDYHILGVFCCLRLQHRLPLET